MIGQWIVRWSIHVIPGSWFGILPSQGAACDSLLYWGSEVHRDAEWFAWWFGIPESDSPLPKSYVSGVFITFQCTRTNWNLHKNVQLVTISNSFPLEVLQKCQHCHLWALRKNFNFKKLSEFHIILIVLNPWEIFPLPVFLMVTKTYYLIVK